MIRPEYKDFLMIYEQKSLSRAADKLDKYQGSLSKTLAQIELELGFQLFIRSNRGLIPTEQAHKLYSQILTQNQMWTDYKKLSHDQSSEVSGLLHIGGHASVLMQFLSLFSNLNTRFPQLELKFSLDRSPEITRKVIHHEIDLALVTNPQQYKELVIKELKTEAVALFTKESKPKNYVVYNPELISSASIVKGLPSKQKLRQIPIRDYNLAAGYALQLKALALLPGSIASRFNLNKKIGRNYFSAKLCLIYRADRKIDRRILDLF